MLEQRIRVISEALARTVDRRAFLKQAGGVVVSGVTALALGSLMPSHTARAAAQAGPHVPNVPQCAPPGPYCNYEGGSPPQPDSCHGAHCYQHLSGGQVQMCHVYYAFYQVGCWSTQSGGGYWTCCDCQCANGSTCGCAEFTTTPVTLAE
jgi:hypothetical protein